MIYYPLSTLMLAGIRDICVITTPEDQESFRRLLGDGSWLGLNLHYEVQLRPEGIAQAFMIAKEFVGRDAVSLVLGDNIFYGHEFPKALQRAVSRKSGGTVFAYQVRDPSRYGVVEFDKDGKAVSIEEKGKILEITIAAADVNALRAALNSYLRWVRVGIEVADLRQASNGN